MLADRALLAQPSLRRPSIAHHLSRPALPNGCEWAHHQDTPLFAPAGRGGWVWMVWMVWCALAALCP